MRRAALLLGLVLLASGYLPDPALGATGRVEIWITDHRPGIADFSELWVGVGPVMFHQRGAPRDAGWVQVLGGAPAVDIVPLKDGRSALVGTASVPPGRYDAVQVRFGEVRGVRQGGGRVDVVPLGGAVAVELDMRVGTAHRLLLDLYVEDQSDHQPGRYVLKLRDVRRM